MFRSCILCFAWIQLDLKIDKCAQRVVELLVSNGFGRPIMEQRDACRRTDY